MLGRVCVKALLSGMPECKFGVNDKLLMKGAAEGAAAFKSGKPGDRGI